MAKQKKLKSERDEDNEGIHSGHLIGVGIGTIVTRKDRTLLNILRTFAKLPNLQLPPNIPPSEISGEVMMLETIFQNNLNNVFERIYSEQDPFFRDLRFALFTNVNPSIEYIGYIFGVVPYLRRRVNVETDEIVIQDGTNRMKKLFKQLGINRQVETIIYLI